MYDKWQKAIKQTNQTDKLFGVYLQSTRSNLLDLDKVEAPNETQLIHRIKQSLRSKIRVAFHRNLTGSKDLPTFLEVVKSTKSSIHLEH